MEQIIDPHHCRCIWISPQDILLLKDQLEQLGFHKEFEENHGQVFGRVLRVKNQLQLHIKVMKNGMIEGEMEPPPAYPGAHLNQKYCYSAHKEIKKILQHINFQYSIISDIPSTCINPIIKKPRNPIHAKTIAGSVLAVFGLTIVLDQLLKDSKNNKE